MTRDEILSRAARAAAASKASNARYSLGKGGRDPQAVSPLELLTGKVYGADCSGTVAWIHAEPRLNARIAAGTWGEPRVVAPGHGMGAVSLKLKGIPAGRRIEQGEFFKFGMQNRTYMVTEDVTANARGEAIIRITPKINRSVGPDLLIEPLGWIETTQVYRDATGPRNMFVRVERALPADVIVWPDAGGREGHIGLITTVDKAGQPLTVTHCSSSNARVLGHSIADTPGIVQAGGGGVPWAQIIRNRNAILVRHWQLTQ
jgi:hypothetical protein